MIVAASLALAAAVAGGAEDPDAICLERLAPLSAPALVRQAVRMLAATGHDPASFRIELRLEDAWRPDSGRLGARREPSVVFHPLGAAGYALRVHPALPCGVGWLWRPERFTPWQTAALARAGEAVRARSGATAEPAEVQVAESRERLAVYVWAADRGPDEDPTWTVILRKADLVVLGVD